MGFDAFTCTLGSQMVMFCTKTEDKYWSYLIQISALMYSNRKYIQLNYQRKPWENLLKEFPG